MQESLDSIIESMSSFILSQTDSSELSQELAVEDKNREGKLELLKDIQDTRKEITSELNKELNSLSRMNEKASTKASTQNNSMINSLDIVERLFEYEKRAKNKIAEQIDLKRKREEQELKQKPVISSGTKKLIKTKKYIPIYFKERLQEIETEKNKKMEKLKKEVNEKRRQAEEESIANSIPSYKGSEITNVELCFDPSAIKPMLYQSPHPKSQLTSEEEELKKCSFRPKTDKRSDIILAQRNYYNKSVIERLTEYGRYQQETLKEKCESVKVKPTVKKRNEATKIFHTKPEESNIDDFVKMVLAQAEQTEDTKEEANISVINKYLQ